ncbi:2-(1,2-epoxy-1,2-dihydrophenyl)acetyl-CoA isomerase PaaG [Acidocella sp.]|uniref:2-(1,2-epoxy-1,2-dihydrophenyl)acetyl-CoA isomerase PaaG n=1 Tax=Acidocella sp. TaxID=50710 RepID=UPI0026374846|nr:2-(1,2-epoxy-1,2-dihydrophenyl)acetyl-CoA isomerase PaaG [Acidocella sp.]
MSDVLLVTRHEGWMELTLNRPERLNAFNEALHAALALALAEAAEESWRAVLLSGAGRGFCAGQDLGDRAGAEGPPDLGETLERFYNPLVRRLRRLQKPVICAVNGVAAGAGANIALACDIVLAARSAKFIQSFAKIGLVPDAGGSFFLPRLVGEARARGLALLGEPVAAEQAERWGMIWKAVDDAALMSEARALAAHLATQPTQGLALTKAAFNASAGNSLDEQLNVERDLQRAAGRTPDYREGVTAFVAKRAPRFTGRPA